MSWSWIAIAMLFALALSSCATFRTPYTVKFTDEACIQPLHDFTYVTCKPLDVIVNDKIITVPAFFQTDLASVPRIFWNILPPQQSNFVAPAILHDYLYMSHICTRKQSDDILYSALRTEGAGRLTANIMWVGVRLFGGKHYENTTQH